MSNVQDWLSQFQQMNPQEEELENKKEYKNDMYKEVLPAIDLRDKNFYNTRTSEQKLELAKNMWMVMRNMSSAQKHAEHHILAINEIVNDNFKHFVRKVREGKEGHPELQWLLLCICGSGQRQFHPFIKPPKGMVKSKLEETIISYFPMLNEEERELLLTINTREELEQFFKDNGYDDKTIKDLFSKNGTEP